MYYVEMKFTCACCGTLGTYDAGFEPSWDRKQREKIAREQEEAEARKAVVGKCCLPFVGHLLTTPSGAVMFQKILGKARDGDIHEVRGWEESSKHIAEDNLKYVLRDEEAERVVETTQKLRRKLCLPQPTLCEQRGRHSRNAGLTKRQGDSAVVEHLCPDCGQVTETVHVEQYQRHEWDR